MAPITVIPTTRIGTTTITLLRPGWARVGIITDTPIGVTNWNYSR